MKSAYAILSISAVIVATATTAFAVPQFPTSHPDAPNWIADVRQAEQPTSPSPTPVSPVPEVVTDPISYTELALAVNDQPQPSPDPIVVQTPVQTAFQTVEPVVGQQSDASWYDEVEKYEIGDSYIVTDREQFDFQVAYRPLMANGQLSPVPEPSSILGLAAPTLGSLVYWRRRRRS